MSKEIDFSKLPPNDICIPCAKTGMKVKTHKDYIQPGRAFLDLIHSDIYGPFLKSDDGAKYFVTFLNDWDKASDIVLLRGKSDVLAAFQLFQRRYKRGDYQICCFCTDSKREYSSQACAEHRAKYSII